MRKLSSTQIRQMWLDFYQEKNHEIIKSASLIPKDDNTLLWINAGIAPLKKYFDGRVVPSNKRMANSQKCIRTNDIDNVGKTARHHTFFEMLGNFSIGDYFRKEALTWAIEILTSPKWFAFDLEKLYFTIYTDDEESYKLWIELGVSSDHIIRLENNFWEIGEGPCGPDTEIFYDRGSKYDLDNLGIKLLKEEIENDRYIEIWNIVFSQFNSIPNTKRENYPELPHKNIDTGMGLERVCCIMQETETNYETDLFMPIINEISRITGFKYSGQMAFKVISDHIKSIVFAVSDGAIISNEGRGYVLRRLLRRAVRYSKQFNMSEPFLYRLTDIVCEIMKSHYPYLLDTKQMVSKIIKTEEEKFLQTLEFGEKKLIEHIKTNPIISKEFAFLLFDTFGFPIELTLEIAQENDVKCDLEGFYVELKKQKELSRANRNDIQSMNNQMEDMLNFEMESLFIGYDTLESNSICIAIFKDGESLSKAEGCVVLVFDKTPFYATSGGQIGDDGIIIHKGIEYKVKKCLKLPNGQNGLLVDVLDISVQDEVFLKVDSEIRNSIKRNHSSTHLLNEALRVVLGKHVHQLGSSITKDELRFDFNNFTQPTNEQILEIEKLVNLEISKNNDVFVNEVLFKEIEKDVQALFGEKYGEFVRVVKIGFSKELCGGCHVSNTKDINQFVIRSCENKGSGVYRIEGFTGFNLEDRIKNELDHLYEEISIINNKQNELLEKASKENISLVLNEVKFKEIKPSYLSYLEKKEELIIFKNNLKELEKQYNKIKQEKNIVSYKEYLNEVVCLNNIPTLILKTNLEIPLAKDLIDRISDHLGKSVIIFCNIINDSLLIICKSKEESINANFFVKEASKIVGGSGGGRSDFAQAGGKDLSKVDLVIDFAQEYLKNKL